MADTTRCGYCRQRKLTTEMALMAPTGQESKWACFVCLDQIEMYFKELADAGCEACSATVDMLRAGRVAREHFEATGSMAIVDVRPAAKEHRPDCPVLA